VAVDVALFDPSEEWTEDEEATKIVKKFHQQFKLASVTAYPLL
jgi:hypothetical protein